MRRRWKVLTAVALSLILILSFGLIACDPKGYKATFNSNGGTDVAAMEGKTAIESEPSTTRSGYDFAGWFTDEALSGERVVFPYTLTEDVTFYAKWTEHKTPDEPEPDDPKYANEGEALGAGIDSVVEALFGVMDGINTESKFGYNLGASVNVGADANYRLDLSALLDFTAGKTSSAKIYMDFGADNKKVVEIGKLDVMSLLDTLGVKWDGKIDQAAIDGIKAGYAKYKGLISTVANILTDAGTLVYNEETNSATVGISSHTLSTQFAALLPLLKQVAPDLNLQKVIDDLLYDTLKCDVDLPKILAELDFKINLTFDLDENDLFEGLTVDFSMEEGGFSLTELESKPTYDADGTRTIVPKKDSEDKDVVKTFNVDAVKAVVGIDLTAITSVDRPNIDDFTESGLINIETEGDVKFNKAVEADAEKGTLASVETQLTFDWFLKANFNPFVLLGENNSFTGDKAADAGYLHLKFYYDASKHPDEPGVAGSAWKNEMSDSWFEIVYDPTNSKDTNIYIYARIYNLGNTTGGQPISLTLNVEDLAKYIASSASATALAAEGNDVDYMALISKIIGYVSTHSTEEVANKAFSMIKDFAINYVTEKFPNPIIGDLTLAAILQGINYDMTTGLDVDVSKIGNAIGELTGWMIDGNILFGQATNVVVRVDHTEFFTAPVPGKYNAYDSIKGKALSKEVKIEEGVKVEYGTSFDEYLAATNVANSKYVDTTITFTDGVVKQKQSFQVAKVVGYDPTKVGKQVVTLYGFYADPDQGIIAGAVNDMVGIPYGLQSTTMEITVNSPLDPVDAKPTWTNADNLIVSTGGNVFDALNVQVTYTDAAGNKQTASGNRYNAVVLNKDGSALANGVFADHSVTVIGNYILRVTIGGALTHDVEFSVYSAKLPGTDGKLTDGSLKVGDSAVALMDKAEASFSYVNKENGQTVTKEFTASDLKLYVVGEKVNHLDENGIVKDTFKTGRAGQLVVTVTVNGFTADMTISTGIVKGKPNTGSINFNGFGSYDLPLAGQLFMTNDSGDAYVTYYDNNGDEHKNLQVFPNKGEDGNPTYPYQLGSPYNVDALVSNNVTVKFFAVSDGVVGEEVTDSVFDATTGKFKEDAVTDADVTLAVKFYFNNGSADIVLTPPLTMTLTYLDSAPTFDTEGVLAEVKQGGSLKGAATVKEFDAESRSVIGFVLTSHDDEVAGIGDTDTELIEKVPQGLFFKYAWDMDYSRTKAVTSVAVADAEGNNVELLNGLTLPRSVAVGEGYVLKVVFDSQEYTATFNIVAGEPVTPTLTYVEESLSAVIDETVSFKCAYTNADGVVTELTFRWVTTDESLVYSTLQDGWMPVFENGFGLIAAVDDGYGETVDKNFNELADTTHPPIVLTAFDDNSVTVDAATGKVTAIDTPLGFGMFSYTIAVTIEGNDFSLQVTAVVM